MNKKARTPRNPKTVEELRAAMDAHLVTMRGLRKENTELVSAYRANVKARKDEIQEYRKLEAALKKMKADAKAKKIAARKAELEKKKAKKTKPAAKPAPKKTASKKAPVKLARKAPAKKPAMSITPETVETPNTLMAELGNMEIF